MKGYCIHNAGNRQIMFVKRFSFLGIILDNELLLEPLYKNVCRQVEQKLFMLRKVRRYITKNASICVYKYIQRIQNNAIRTCLLYNRVDHITTD